jgi:tripeptide aminopeptidase
MAEQERLIQTFIELARLASPSKGEDAVARYIVGALREIGVNAEDDGTAATFGGTTGNLIAHLPGDIAGPTLLLSAHMDTVEPARDISPSIKDGFIFSGGETVLGADDKAGVAIIIEAIRLVTENRIPHYGLMILFTAAEEIGLTGSKALRRKSISADYGFVFDEGHEMGHITVSAPYQDKFECSFFGRGAHAGIEPEKGISAVEAASEAVRKMRLGRIDAETTANIGIIRGGSAINIVPDSALLEGEARSLSEPKLKLQIKTMEDSCRQAARDTGAVCEIKVTRLYDGYALADDNPAVELAVEAVKKTGLTPAKGKSGGGSDTNVLNAMGIPSVNLSVGYEDVHTTREKIALESLRAALDVAIALITGESR